MRRSGAPRRPGRLGSMATRTLVSFHAHPDDEALLTGGTLARAAAAGHPVVLVVATDGEAGAASHRAGGAGPGRTPAAGPDRAAPPPRCSGVERLRLPDSGWRDGAVADPGTFSRLPVAVAAEPLVRILRDERADALTVYDPAGGYGHPDHRQVHRAGLHAAALAGTPSVLEA